MKKIALALGALAMGSVSASAADLAPRYTKAPAPVLAPSWTGFYLFGGVGGGLWAADGNEIDQRSGTALTRDSRSGGSGWFGTVGAGYDWQFNTSWVAGVFADGQFGSLRGSLTEYEFTEGRETLRTSYAAGVRLGYLVAPNVLSYVNAGYSGSDWSGATLSSVGAAGGPALFTTPSFHRDGWFVGSGVENSLNFFGISAPGWFMKTEYRAAYYDRVTLPETFTPLVGGGPTGISNTFKPWVQTASTSLVYRFNSGGAANALAADVTPRYTKAPARVAAGWTAFYVFGGGGGGLWAADTNEVNQVSGLPLTRDIRMGGSGWFGTVGAGYDWQFNPSWVVGVFADGQFGSLRGSLTERILGVEGSETLRTSYAAGVRLGYLVAPNVLSYVNAGYSGSDWSGATFTSLLAAGSPAVFTTPSFHRNGVFVGSGVENSFDFFGISAPGWFMKTEYRAAYYDRATLPETFTPLAGGGLTGVSNTFKPWVQTISTSLVYRFN